MEYKKHDQLGNIGVSCVKFSPLYMISILFVNKECLDPFILDLNVYENFFGVTYNIQIHIYDVKKTLNKLN